MKKNLTVDQVVSLYLAIVGHAGCSSGEVYARVTGDGIKLDTHLGIVRELVRQGFFEIRADWLTLTAKGRELHDDIAAILLTARA